MLNIAMTRRLQDSPTGLVARLPKGIIAECLGVESSNRGNIDILNMLSSLCKIICCLQTQPHIGTPSKRHFKTYCHLRRYCALAIDDIVELLPCNPKGLCCISNTHPQFVKVRFD